MRNRSKLLKSNFRTSKGAKNDIFVPFEFTKIWFHVKSEWLQNDQSPTKSSLNFTFWKFLEHSANWVQEIYTLNNCHSLFLASRCNWQKNPFFDFCFFLFGLKSQTNWFHEISVISRNICTHFHHSFSTTFLSFLASSSVSVAPTDIWLNFSCMFSSSHFLQSS